jgi:hypothetical protein
MLGFLVGLFAVSRETLAQLLWARRGRHVRWHKTEHPHNLNGGEGE